MPVAASPCLAVSKKRSVASVRSMAASRVTQPRSTPTPYAVSPKPTAAIEENAFVGQRSGTSPFLGLPRSQNHWKVRRSSSSTEAGTGWTSGSVVATGGAAGTGATARGAVDDGGDDAQPAI